MRIFGKGRKKLQMRLLNTLSSGGGNVVGTVCMCMDYLIAGVALANEAVLATRNLAEFLRVPDLTCEDWF